MSTLRVRCRMEIECDGELWMAHGEGAKRMIVVEGDSRKEVVKAFGEVFHDQLAECDPGLIVELREELWNEITTTNPRL